jgi:hypothetical protein
VPGQTVTLEVPDMYGRPWAKMWERYFEKGMRNPDRALQEQMFDFDQPPAQPGDNTQ